MSRPLICRRATCRLMTEPPCLGGQVGGGVGLTRYAVLLCWLGQIVRRAIGMALRKAFINLSPIFAFSGLVVKPPMPKLAGW